MPDNIIPATPTDTMPSGLCAAFTEEHRVEAFVNAYQDGSSDRAAKVLNPRRFFKMTRLVTVSQYEDLYIFYSNHLVQPFWFYNLPETVPPFKPPADSPIGRYAVVFDGSWSEEIRVGRSRVSFGLREVA